MDGLRVRSILKAAEQEVIEAGMMIGEGRMDLAMVMVQRARMNLICAQTAIAELAETPKNRAL